jgi:hypothetical protein
MHFAVRIRRYRQVMVVVEVVDCSNVKACCGLRINRIVDAERDDRGLMEYLAADGQLFRHLFLYEPAEEPVITIGGVVALIDPLATAAIGRPIAEAFLQPERKIGANVAGAETASFVPCRQLNERVDADH